MIYAGILAGGKGSRMGNTEMPKQFLMLGSKPIFIHTVEQFLLNEKIDKVLVICPKAWMSHAEDTILKYIDDTSRIIVVEGGSSRNDTILNGCKYIEEKYGLTNEDIIITHDAVRPFVTQRIIEDNIKAVKKNGAVDTVIPATDTIVESKNGEIISNIPLRGEMYQGQTPQTFNIKNLMELFNQLNANEKNILTDACKAFTIKGKKVDIVLGEVFNMKITTLHDLKLAEAIVIERDYK